ncbi:MAG: sensor histidine kinase, partial [Candidatus Kapaibacteriota bacterium]
TKEKLEEALKEKDKLFSIIAHDLKSPFSGFLGIANLLSTDIESFTKEELVELAKSLKESAENVYKLLENLLEWSRIQRGLIPFNPENHDLFSLVEHIHSLHRANIEKKSINFTNLIPNYLEAKFDINMISTVLRNLISNAIKFTPKGGKITIDYKQNNNELTISVSDTGIGIPNRILPDLFRLGAKISRPGTDGESSTGLGLILCKEYIERHKGKIWVESQEGYGSTFYFTLPRE